MVLAGKLTHLHRHPGWQKTEFALANNFIVT